MATQPHMVAVHTLKGLSKVRFWPYLLVGLGFSLGAPQNQPKRHEHEGFMAVNPVHGRTPPIDRKP